MIVLQELLQALGRGQGTIAAFNELSSHLLREYATDDTRKIKEITEKHNAAWSNITNRYIKNFPIYLSIYIYVQIQVLHLDT